MNIENIQDLRVLVETARGGSLSAAARHLDITPAAASAALKRLETQLALRLFERSTRAMRLTEAGQTLLEYAERALDLLHEGVAQADRERGELTGAYVIDGERLQMRQLRLGRGDGDGVVVLSGLKAGERVAADPVAALQALQARRKVAGAGE